MSVDAQVVIIGGGAMGVSLAYHLARRNWSEIVLVEKNELTAGSTWHAAGLCTHFAHNATIQELRAASVRLYRDRLPEETGMDTGFHACGALRVTRSEERMREFRHVQGLGRFTGHEFRIIDPRELAELYPLCVTDGLLGAIHEPFDGYVDPTLATNAMAAGARARGVRIQRHDPVETITRTDDQRWRVSTRSGDIVAAQIVNAAGTWCREIGEMMGMDLPVVPMLHQYLVTDGVDEIRARHKAELPELPMIRDPEESWYLRQERDGFILGPYEKAAQPWAVDGVPPEFGMELLPPDLDRIEHIVVQAMERVPAVATAGIKTIVHGPITFTPDGNPLIGPAFGLPNAWLLTGSSMGVMEGGGAGKFLADWMTDGAPPMDALAVDARRYGDYADREFRLAKAVECFGLQFGVHYPHEEREAGRGRRLTPIYDQQASAGAVFGCAYGWERPNWYARDAESRSLPLTFSRPGWHDSVRGECLDVMHGVGLADLSAFSKFEVRGRGAVAFVEQLGTNRAPAVGRISLTYALTPAGGVASEFTVMRPSNSTFVLTSAAAAERHDWELLLRRAESFADVEVRNVNRDRAILGVMGPLSRQLLERALEGDFDNLSFPWMSTSVLSFQGTELLAARLSYVGELGWELHVPMRQLKPLWQRLSDTGGGMGMVPFGAYAMNAMRLEKGYRAWGLDLTSERTPLELGLRHLIRCKDRDFIGREAMLARRDDDWSMQLLQTREPCYPFYSHPLMQGNDAVGIVTSGAAGHRCERTLALGLLGPRWQPDKPMRMEIVGEPHEVSVCDEIPYDPENRKLRS